MATSNSKRKDTQARNDLVTEAIRLREKFMTRLDGCTFVDAKSLPLDEWLSKVDEIDGTQEFMMLSTCFPTSAHRKEYLDTIHSRDDASIRRLLRHFLPSMGTHPADLYHLQGVLAELGKQDARREIREYDVRLLRYLVTKGSEPVWEGIHWVLDAVRQAPRDAVQVLRTFLRANWQQLSDAYIAGLEDAAEIIRWRYLISPHTRDRCKGVVASLSPRDLELLAAALYDAMGYRYEVTRKSKDGGVDVIALSESGRKRQRHLIQCKHTRLVGVEPVNQILAVVERRRATQAVLLTSGRFTKGALAIQAEEDRVELVDGETLILRLNEYLGPDWYTRSERILAGVARRVGRTS
ncbi:restriction endonuclease [Sorangium atrum]|uniref:Restriction endonuclease n=1 Tax=Sorangium atrum TaxID=2995308 RepID=A0ABT5BX81_9BACT|nr:restriction endonuclease [Sorangium aterium]MDC0678731.1 restriction endonuclease [Sorangium aterium]